MKTIQHKVYILEREDEAKLDMSDLTSLNVAVNDEPTELTVDDLFKKFEGYEKDKLVGWSILQFFKFEDGYLVDEDRNKICFYSKQLDCLLYFKKIRNAIIMLSDIEVQDAYIRNVKKLLSLSRERMTTKLEGQIQDVKDEIKENEENPTEEVLVEPTEEEAKEPVAEAVAEEGAKVEVVEEPVAESTPEPVVEVAPEPVAEPVIETVPTPVAEPVLEPTPEPAVEVVPEPVAEVSVEPTPEPVVEVAAEPVVEPTPEPEPDEDSYEYLKRYYTGLGYEEYSKDNFRFLYKEDDFPYFIKITDDTFEQLNGDLITNTDKKFVYEIEENGKSRKITFEKAQEAQ